MAYQTLCVDDGVENAHVALFIHSFGHIIRGKGVHNQRREQLTVDMWNGATNIFHSPFYEMDSMGILEPNNEVHKVFMNQWNLHGLCTERGQNPYQLFVSGILHNNSSLHPVSFPQDDHQKSSVDKVLHNIMCTSSFVRWSCKGHGLGCLCLLLLKPNTAGVKMVGQDVCRSSDCTITLDENYDWQGRVQHSISSLAAI